MESGQPDEPITPAPPYHSSWSINWGGAIGVSVAVVIVLILALQGGDDSSTDAGGSNTTTSTTVAAPSTTRSTVAATTTTQAATTTSTTVARRRVLIRGEVKPCRFGSACLVAHFEIEGFDRHPGRFTCIYPNSTSEFGFNDDDVVDACLSGDEGDTITIEVDGVRSSTISAEHLDGEP